MVSDNITHNGIAVSAIMSNVDTVVAVITPYAVCWHCQLFDLKRYHATRSIYNSDEVFFTFSVVQYRWYMVEMVNIFIVS